MRHTTPAAWLQRTLWGLLVFGLGALPAGRADVYELLPGGHGQTLDRLLNARVVLKDTVTVNGVAGALEVSLSAKRLAEAREALAPVLAGARQQASDNAILLDFPGDTTLTRYYLLSFGRDLKTVIFALRLPKSGLDQPAARFWPAELPTPSGTIEQVIHLNRGNGTFATFSTTASGVDMISRFDAQLVGDGWERVSVESGRGGVYLNRLTHKLLAVSSVAGEHETQATVYLRPVGE